ncbi:hypothetical protein COV18_03090 [Candidatus Woesearchaeota archaeon CG10_big_fil_rev_8_21_14_0_10_37_12]|nr:MAG: hypothetical protein COV18_03090 [Candidatus Woesearchaeota archaeon CG10_big_fil_rev_8_21_14_0_10_37_12]
MRRDNLEQRLDELWELIPETDKLQIEVDTGITWRAVSGVEKVELLGTYITFLQEQAARGQGIEVYLQRLIEEGRNPVIVVQQPPKYSPVAPPAAGVSQPDRQPSLRTVEYTSCVKDHQGPQNAVQVESGSEGNNYLCRVAAAAHSNSWFTRIFGLRFLNEKVLEEQGCPFPKSNELRRRIPGLYKFFYSRTTCPLAKGEKVEEKYAV